MNFEGVLAIVGIVGAALLVVAANDWWKRRLPPARSGPHRLRELNQPLGFFRKLWLTCVLVVFGALITPLFVLGLHLTANPVLREIFQYVLETIGVFYVVLVIYIWWRPGPLARLYRRAESDLLTTAYVVSGALIAGCVVVVLVKLALSAIR